MKNRIFVYMFKRCRKQKAKEVKDSISVSGAAAPSVGDHGRHEPSRTSEAGAFPADSHTGQTSTSEPKSGKYLLKMFPKAFMH